MHMPQRSFPVVISPERQEENRRVGDALNQIRSLLPSLIAQVVKEEIRFHFESGGAAALRERALQLADEVLGLLAEREQAS